MLSHLVKWKRISLDMMKGYGALGVHIFFVLSGYLINFPAAFVFLGVVICLYWREMRWTHIAAAVFYVSNLDVTRPWIFGHL